MKNTRSDDKLVFINDEARLEHIAGLSAMEIFEDEINSKLSELSDDDWAIINSIDMRKKISEASAKREMANKRHTAGAFVLKAVAIAACIVSFFSILYFSPIPFMEPVRAQIMEFIIERYPSFNQYILRANGVFTDLENHYMPSYIPEGYELKLDNLVPGMERTVIWEDSDKKQIRFRQLLPGRHLSLKTEDAVVSNIDIGDMAGELIQKNGKSTIILYKYDNILALTSELPLDECVKIMDSIQAEQ